MEGIPQFLFSLSLICEEQAITCLEKCSAYSHLYFMSLDLKKKAKPNETKHVSQELELLRISKYQVKKNRQPLTRYFREHKRFYFHSVFWFSCAHI